MHIDDYQFGRIRIDGSRYDKDLIILHGQVLPNWWRDEGHSLSMQDLQVVAERPPARLIIGMGVHGRMQVPQRTIEALTALGIEVETYATDEAVRRFNRASDDDDVALALHLTC